MSNIVLSASVRQNLLSLQSTADLLATTQNRLATGNKVNTALDNPTNYFTAQSLNNRASDISNLLDGIGNGVQVLQAANTGITSLQKLVDSAKSVANQALQASVGYSAKSSVTTTAVSGATADDLRGTPTAATAGTLTAGTFSAVNVSGAGSAATAGTLTEGAFTAVNVSGTGSAATAAAAVTGSGFTTLDVSSGSVGFTLNVDGTSKAISIDAAAVTAFTGAGGTLGGTASALTAADVAKIVDYQFNNTDTTGTGPVQVSGGQLQISSATTGASSQVTISSFTNTANAGTPGLVNVSNTGAAAVAADSLAFSVTVDGGAAQNVSLSAAAVTAYNSANSTTLNAASLSATDVSNLINSQVGSAVSSVSGGKLVFTSGTTGASSSVALSAVTAAGSATNTTGITTGTNTGAAAVAADSLSFTVTLDGGSAHNVTLDAAAVTAYNTANATSLNAASLSATDVSSLINSQVGSAVSSVSGGKLVFTSATTGATSSVALSAVTAAGSATNTTGVSALTGTGTASTSALDGLTLSIGATGSGTATNITFGDGTNGTVKSLNDLNSALASNNLLATLDASGKISITTTNDAASSTIGTIGGTAAGAGKAFNGLVAGAPVKDAAAQLVRSNLVDQYNNILDQIKTTAQDASYNGIDLLNGDQLKLTFNETGTSTLKIQGVNFDYTGLGLSKLTAGTDFLDNSSANSAISSLDTASSSLRTEASALGSNLSIVQIRQDFSKNLINVLQTGSSNLTLADTNEEAANSQALSTRQSIAVSALSLANQSQQSVLQLLR
jgi:flagellin